MHFTGGSSFRMIPILRKHLTCLLSNNAHHRTISCTLYPFFFSTYKEAKLVPSPAIIDSLLRKYELSPLLASKLAYVFNRIRDSGGPDSILSFLKENGFSNAQLERIMKHSCGFLVGNLEDTIKPKIRFLQGLGLPPDDTAKSISCNPAILSSSLNTKFIPSISVLKALLGTNDAVAKLWKNMPWVLTSDLEGTMVPNIEFLKSCGVPMERIFKLLYNWPRCLFSKPAVIRKSVEKVEKMGVNRSSNMFIHALCVVSSVSSKTWELKLQGFRDCGFSESDMVTMFQKAPHLFTRSAKQLERTKDIVLATGKYDITCTSLSFSIERKYKPRFQILEILESKNLIKNWPALSTVSLMTEKTFFDKFVDPYLSEVGEAYFAKNSITVNKRNEQNRLA